MWILRFLSGPLAGQTEVLSKPSTLVGRASHCDIRIQSGNVSKEHARIEIFDEKLIITDAGSRNGTFVNGVQIRSSKVRSGDKVAINDIFFEVQKVPETWAGQFRQTQQVQNAQYSQHAQQAQHIQQSAAPSATHGNVAYQAQMHDAAPEPMYQDEPKLSMMQDLMQGRVPQWATGAHAYIERVMLPGLYRLPEIFEFKWVLAGFMAVFIILVTMLSTLPLIRILKASIEDESQQHAITIATTLARVNLPALQQGLDSSLSVDLATSRPGVKKAYILSNIDGNILAPASDAGKFPELPYVHEGRKGDRESVVQVDDSTVVAMVPVRFYNAETGSQAVTA